MRGRKKLPESVKKAQGTLKKCRSIGTSLVPSHIDFVPPPPGEFDQGEKELYFQVTNELRAKGILDSRDLHIIVLFCKSFSNWRKYEQDENRIEYVTDKQGNTTSNISAAFKIAKQEEVLSIKLASELGFGPIARERLKAQIQKTNPSDDDFT
jgi:P27 family predicted phage terminase small subunit